MSFVLLLKPNYVAAMFPAELIPKEEVTNYQFRIAPESNIRQFEDKLSGAMRLGNEFKSKAFIAFLTADGPKAIETTVWTVAGDYLQIKGGVLIPLASLLDIDY